MINYITVKQKNKIRGFKRDNFCSVDINKIYYIGSYKIANNKKKYWAIFHSSRNELIVPYGIDSYKKINLNMFFELFRRYYK